MAKKQNKRKASKDEQLQDEAPKPASTPTKPTPEPNTSQSKASRAEMRAKWRSIYERIRSDPRMLGHWHEHEDAIFHRLAEAEFIREPVKGWQLSIVEAAEGKAKADVRGIWPFGKTCEVPQVLKLHAVYLAVGLVLDRLFESRVLVTERMIAGIARAWRDVVGPEATDEQVLKWFGPHKDGQPMTCETIEGLWQTIAKDIEAWPENHDYGKQYGGIQDEEASEAASHAMADPCVKLPPWHYELTEGPLEWSFKAFGKSFEVGVEPITTRDLIEAFDKPEARKAANAAAARISTEAAQYDVEVRQRFAFPLRWLQGYQAMPAFLEKLGRPAGFDLFDGDDWINYRDFERQVLPRLCRLYGVERGTPYDGPEVWQTERTRYMNYHPYGYVYMERPGCPSRDQDAHLFFLAVLRDGVVGVNEVVSPEVRAIWPSFYAAVIEYCAGLSSRSPQAFRAILAELASRPSSPEVPAEVTTPASIPPEQAGAPMDLSPECESGKSTRSWEKVGYLYDYAIEKHSFSGSPTDDQVYDYLRSNRRNIEEAIGGEIDLPERNTFKRYLRHYRKDRGEQKNRSRVGRDGGSIAARSDV